MWGGRMGMCFTVSHPRALLARRVLPCAGHNMRGLPGRTSSKRETLTGLLYSYCNATFPKKAVEIELLWRKIYLGEPYFGCLPVAWDITYAELPTNSRILPLVYCQNQRKHFKTTESSPLVHRDKAHWNAKVGQGPSAHLPLTYD